jgi:hypothetical protein
VVGEAIGIDFDRALEIRHRIFPVRLARTLPPNKFLAKNRSNRSSASPRRSTCYVECARVIRVERERGQRFLVLRLRTTRSRTPTERGVPGARQRRSATRRSSVGRERAARTPRPAGRDLSSSRRTAIRQCAASRGAFRGHPRSLPQVDGGLVLLQRLAGGRPRAGYPARDVLLALCRAPAWRPGRSPPTIPNSHSRWYFPLHSEVPCNLVTRLHAPPALPSSFALGTTLLGARLNARLPSHRA